MQLMGARFRASSSTWLFTQQEAADLWYFLLGILWMQEVCICAREGLTNIGKIERPAGCS